VQLFTNSQFGPSPFGAPPGSAIASLLPAPIGAKWLVVDYAIVSSEVPGGWLGTRFNDYFEISIDCGPQGPPNPIPAYVATSGSINELGPNAFDSKGATYCYRLSMEIEKVKGKTCQVGISVADAIDHDLHTAVCAKAYYV